VSIAADCRIDTGFLYVQWKIGSLFVVWRGYASLAVEKRMQPRTSRGLKDIKEVGLPSAGELPWICRHTPLDAAGSALTHT
jgi:hypothetical protein